MCGFTTLNLGFPSSDIDDFERIKESLNLIKHRGPDYQKEWISDNRGTIMAHARLSIIDLKSGNQPFTEDNSRYTIVFNGEIYNYKEIKKYLNLKPLTNSDTEILLLSYIKLKEKCLNILRGMFTFCIYDKLENSVFIARDRFGIKPLFFTKYKSGIVFSSEIKGLIPFMRNKEINNNGLSDYFNFQFCLNNKTLFKHIDEFPKASFAFFKNGKLIRKDKYWENKYEIDREHNEKWFLEKLRYLMKETISLHCRSDVPIASYMSGGIDSTLISLLSINERNTQNPQAYVGRYISHDGFDESQYALNACKNINLKCNIITIKPKDFIDNFENLIWHLEQPFAGPGSFGKYMVSKKASASHKVILGGQGGDEIFGGYSRYLIAYLDLCINNQISGKVESNKINLNDISDTLSTLNSYKPLIKEFFSNGLFDDFHKRYWRLINKVNNYKCLIKNEYLNNTYKDFEKLFNTNFKELSPFNKMTRFDFNTLLPALLNVEDRVSMAHGLEARVPFLDHEIIELVSSIPTEIKFRNGELKRLLRMSFKETIPKDILGRKDKMGFPIPLNLWIKENQNVKEFVLDIFKSRKALERFYLQEKLDIEKMINSESLYSRSLWGLLSLEMWQQKFID